MHSCNCLCGTNCRNSSGSPRRPSRKARSRPLAPVGAGGGTGAETQCTNSLRLPRPSTSESSILPTPFDAHAIPKDGRPRDNRIMPARKRTTGENGKMERLRQRNPCISMPTNFTPKQEKRINNQPSHIKLNDGFYTSVYCLLVSTIIRKRKKKISSTCTL